MKRTMIRWVVLIVVVAIAISNVARAQEQKKDDYFGAFVGAAFGDEALVGNDRQDHPNPLVGIRWDHFFCYDLSFFADASYLEYDSDQPFGDTQEIAGRLGVQKLFGKPDGSNWFLAGAAGYVRFDPELANSVHDLSLGVGFGQRFLFGRSGGALQWEIRPEWVLNGLGGGTDDLLDLKATVGWSWAFGGGFPDSDVDGVPECKDQCADTPKGAVVDEAGCPKDADGDGVYDGLDRCPDTPKGWAVDGQGCPKDADGDGVPDGGDSCPDTPAGAQVDAKGCPKDADGDGVFDGIDRCPDTPRGAQVDARGCPTDADGDGVFDGIDRCPDTPRGAQVDATGCPVEVPKAPPIFEPGKKSLVLEGVNFEHDQAVLTPDSTVVLDRVAASLRDWPDVRVEVDGYTDSDGSDAYNQKLSQRRAEAVQQYLASHGVDASRLTAKGFGESNPIADNKSPEGKARNRRVELSKVE